MVYSAKGDSELEEFGSLIKVVNLGDMPDDVQDLTAENYMDADARLNGWNFRRLLGQKYDVVVTNPPYIAPVPSQVEWVKKHFPNSKTDLCVVFIERNFDLIKQSGYLSMITMHSFMFLLSFEKFREHLVASKDIVNMVHLGARAFEEISGEVVQAVAFVMTNAHIQDRLSVYVRLVEYAGQQIKEDLYISGKYRYIAKMANYEHMPCTPIAYWADDNILRCFKEKPLNYYAEPRKGLSTGDNERFLRAWHEIDFTKMGLGMASREEAKQSNKKYFPCNKGGTYRKWYGVNEIVINWENDGKELREFSGSVIRNLNYYFRNGLTWSTMSSRGLSMRYSPQGFLFEAKGSICFARDNSNIKYLMGLLNSKAIDVFLHRLLIIARVPCLGFL